MSPKTTPATTRPSRGQMTGERSIQFGPSSKRVLARLRPERTKLSIAVLLGVASVALEAAGPRILGRATDLIFAGLFGRQLEVGITQAEAVEAARAAGDTRVADVLAAMVDLVPGHGVDFEAVGGVLMFVMAVYAASSLLSWLQGYLLNDVVQATVLRMRADVEDKLHRLPLSYFDRHPRGELISRVTNDIDNLAQSLGQTLGQLLTSLLTAISVVAMMVYLSATMALVAVIAIPAGLWLTKVVMKRSQPLFVDQWQHTGALTAQVEEAFTGHELTKVFGRRHAAESAFAEENEALFRASFGAQFISSLLMPVMTFLGTLSYVAIAVMGGLRVASGAMSLGEVQAFISYSGQLSFSAHAGGLDREPVAVGCGLGRARVRAVGRRRGAGGSHRGRTARGQARTGRVRRRRVSV